MTPRRRLLAVLAPLALVPALAACASGPRERRVRAEFQCEDGRRLRAVYWLDRGEAELDLGRKVRATVPAEPGVPGRAYAGDGWELRGVGDSVTLTTPGAPPTRCTETR